MADVVMKAAAPVDRRRHHQYGPDIAQRAVRQRALGRDQLNRAEQKGRHGRRDMDLDHPVGAKKRRDIQSNPIEGIGHASQKRGEIIPCALPEGGTDHDCQHDQ